MKFFRYQEDIEMSNMNLFDFKRIRAAWILRGEDEAFKPCEKAHQVASQWACSITLVRWMPLRRSSGSWRRRCIRLYRPE